MEALLDFLRMGGYAVYLWPSYALTVAVLFANWHAVRRRRRLALRRLAEAQQP